MRRAVVTGGTGFIGSWLIQELLDNETEVYAIVRNKEKLISQIGRHDNCIVIESPIELLSAEYFTSKKHYDVFYHLGWAGVSPEHKNEVDTQLNNISMALKAADLCKQIGCGLFVASGTVAEYALCDDIMNLNARQTPNDMYGAAKVASHYFLEVRTRQLSQPFIWMVIPSTFGERRTDNNIITYTIRTLIKGEKPKYGALEQMWDFLYVGEVVRAIRLIGEKGTPGKVYGIGSGAYRPLRDYILRIRDLINPSLELGIGEIPTMSKQTYSSCVNIYDLVHDTGFLPQVDFDDGIKRTIEFMRREHDKAGGAGCSSIQ